MGLLRIILKPARLATLQGEEVCTQEMGVPQGLASSPILFTTFLDYALRKTNPNFIKAFADDLAVLTYSEDQAWKTFREIKSAVEEVKMEIHPDKCEFFTNNRKAAERYGVRKVNELKYLGVTLSHSREKTVKIWRDSILKHVKRFAFKLQGARESTRIKICETYTRAKLLYGAVPLTVAGVLRPLEIRAAERRIIKAIVGIPKNCKTEDFSKFMIHSTLGLMVYHCIAKCYQKPPDPTAVRSKMLCTDFPDLGAAKKILLQKSKKKR